METGERKRCDEELMQLFGELDILSVVRIGLVKLIEWIVKEK
jgi:hypothetical protein